MITNTVDNTSKQQKNHSANAEYRVRQTSGLSCEEEYRMWNQSVTINGNTNVPKLSALPFVLSRILYFKCIKIYNFVPTSQHIREFVTNVDLCLCFPVITSIQICCYRVW